jgi:hypothetical protein
MCDLILRIQPKAGQQCNALSVFKSDKLVPDLRIRIHHV